MLITLGSESLGEVVSVKAPVSLHNLLCCAELST